MPEPQTLLTGLAIGESPRWHEDRLWFSNWGAQEIVAVDLEGRSEVVTASRPRPRSRSTGCPTDACSSSRARGAAAAPGARRQPGHPCRPRPPGERLERDRRGRRGRRLRQWQRLRLRGRGAFVPGIIALVGPDGSVRQVADDIGFPNGMVVTHDDSTLIVAESFASRLTAFDIMADGLENRRVWATLRPQAGDGICLDAEGAVWCSVIEDGRPACVGIGEGGHVLQRIELDQFCLACMLGALDARSGTAPPPAAAPAEQLGRPARPGP